MTVFICGAHEIEDLVTRESIDAVLSIEHPNAEDGKGRAPRLENVTQKILSIWDAEEEGVPGGPSEDNITEAFAFLDIYAEKNVAVHCRAGKSRSVGVTLSWLSNELGIEAAIAHVKKIRPIAAPNIAVVKVADRLFNYNGDLVQRVLDDDYFTKNRDAARAEHQTQSEKLGLSDYPERNF